MKRFLLAVPIAVFAVGSGYTAAVRIYTDKSAFLSESGPSTVVENFSSAPLGSVLPGTQPLFGTLAFSYNGTLDGGLNDPFSGQPLIIDNGLVNGSREFMGEVNADGTPSGLHFFTLPYEAFAFGGSFNSTTSGARLTLKINDDVIKFSDHLGGNGTGFLGVVSDDPFTKVTFGVEATNNPSINRSSEVFRLDDALHARAPEQTAPPPAVPAPGALWSMIAGLGLIGFARRRRRA